MDKQIIYLKKKLKKITPVYSLYRRIYNQSQQKSYPVDGSVREIKGIFGGVHEYDFMIAGDTEIAINGYNRIGLSAYQLVEEAISLTNRTVDDYEEFLDYGCGYGRVTRFFVQNLEPHKISVFDVDPGAVSFCANEFGVKPIYLNDRWNFKSVNFDSFDVIWVGSVFTHLSEKFTKQTLQLLFNILNPNGILVFTTHGDRTFTRLQEGYYGERFQRLSDEIIEQYTNRGFSFIPYEYQEVDFLPFHFRRAKDFGMTWMSDKYVNDFIRKINGEDAKLLEYKPLGWDSHQDVYFYLRGV
jgi:SAM-dependent methyltransferase